MWYGRDPVVHYGTYWCRTVRMRMSSAFGAPLPSYISKPSFTWIRCSRCDNMNAQQRLVNASFAFLPLIPPASILSQRISKWWRQSVSKQELVSSMVRPDDWTIENQLLAYVSLAVIGFVATNHLIPNIKVWDNRDMKVLFTATVMLLLMMRNLTPFV